jgi:hypothetical protein
MNVPHGPSNPTPLLRALKSLLEESAAKAISIWNHATNAIAHVLPSTHAEPGALVREARESTRARRVAAHFHGLEQHIGAPVESDAILALCPGGRRGGKAGRKQQ